LVNHLLHTILYRTYMAAGVKDELLRHRQDGGTTSRTYRGTQQRQRSHWQVWRRWMRSRTENHPGR